MAGLVIAGTAATFIAQEGPAQASGAVYPSGYGTLKVANDSLCLDGYGNTSNAGAIIDQYTCNGGANQNFQFVPTSGGYGELQVQNSGQDVTVANSSTAQGTPDIVQEPVNGNAASQWLPQQQSDGSWEFKNLNSGLCLDVYGANSNRGQQLDQWPCKNVAGTNQDFLASATGPGTTTTTTTTAPTTTTTIPTTTTTGATTTTTAPTTTTTASTTSTTIGTTTTTAPGGYPAGYHTLVIGNDSLCLDGYGDSSNAGAVIDQYTCNGGTNQEFQFVPTSGGYGELQVENSGQDVTVANSSTAQGQTDIVQEPVNGSAASQWLPQHQSDGSWEFKNMNSGLCMDVYGNGSNTGQQLDQWPCKNAPGTNQDFSPGVQGEGTLVQVQNFGANPGNDLMYIYVPTTVKAHPGLLVALHQCSGSGPGFYSGTEFASLAKQYGFIVIYPSVTRSYDCWDVNSQQALTHNGGSDPVSIMSMITYAEGTYGADPNNVYVTGASSGGMMTNVMLGDYPDVFKAGAAFMGVPFGCFAGPNSWNSACANGQISMTGQQWGDLVRNAYPGYNGPRPRVQLWHGTADTTLNYENFGQEILQWTNVLGVSSNPVATETPVSGWTETLYGSTTNPVVEGFSIAGAGHVLPETGMAKYAIDFFGLENG